MDSDRFGRQGCVEVILGICHVSTSCDIGFMACVAALLRCFVAAFPLEIAFCTDD